MLLAGSYLFYAAWDYRFLSLILLSTAVNYFAAHKIYVTTNRERRLQWLVITLTYNIGVLFCFKYLEFFILTFVDLLKIFNFSIHYSSLEIILPVGISFYTFHALSYPLDVYHRNLEPKRQLLDFSLFIAFFPQMLAGPIMRAKEFLPQLELIRNLKDVEFRRCLVLFVIGFIKKAVISDIVAPHVDQIFANPQAYQTGDVIYGQILYAIQIYCDFSGYTDMALATAGLLGYTLPQNFNFPFFAGNISEFWRRWHMSLSRWLHDYVYISLFFLGQNRDKSMIQRNLIITMLLCGLWHGAAWGYIIFGIMHGSALVLHQEWQLFVRRRKIRIPFWGLFSTLITFSWASWTFVYFRAKEASVAWYMTIGTLFSNPSAQEKLTLNAPLVIGSLALIHWCFYRWKLYDWLANRQPWMVAILLGGSLALAISFIPSHYQPFIYFQF
ncbi:MAG: MBOAT family protein [Magnetococcales bacterium]|nr:MBOAT family protein [Magnetococcales bacterium]